MIFICEKCGTKLNLADVDDFAEATAEHLCWASSETELNDTWVLSGVKNAEKYIIGPAVVRDLGKPQ